MSDHLSKAGVEARRLCGCALCYGGFEIGARTLAMGPGKSRPTSCLAPQIFDRLLDAVDVVHVEVSE